MPSVSPRFRSIVGSPHDFVWNEAQHLALTSSGSPVVAIDCKSPNFTNYSGKSVTITVGSNSPVVVSFGATADAASAVSQIQTALGSPSPAVAVVIPGTSSNRLQHASKLVTTYGTESDFTDVGIPALTRDAGLSPNKQRVLEYQLTLDRIDAVSDALAVPAGGANVLALRIFVANVHADQKVDVAALWDFDGDWNYSVTNARGIACTDVPSGLVQSPILDTSGGNTSVTALGGASGSAGVIEVVSPTKPLGSLPGITQIAAYVPIPYGGPKSVRIGAIGARAGTDPLQSRPPLILVTGAWAYDT